MRWDFVPLHVVAGEIAPNIERHYAEMSEGDEYGCPNIDWDTYLHASMAGQCVVVTLRDKGVLVGYSAYTISRNPRYKHLIEATGSGLFIEKKYRGRYGLPLLRKADEYLKNIGINETNYIIGGERVGRLLERHGYKSTYKVYARRY